MSFAEQFDLHRAMHMGRLMLHYQPRVHANLTTVRTIGAEALLRWTPDGATWTGVPALDELTEDEFELLWSWKMAQIKEAFAILRQAGWRPVVNDPQFFLSLNLSHKQLGTGKWADQVLDLLCEAGVPGQCIEIELTEQGSVPDIVMAFSSFEQLRAAGVTLALDDFPEGGSSFVRLAQFKFDKVKVDRSMVPDTLESVATWMNKRRILQDLTAIIIRAGATVVIEGVERERQHRFLHTLGVSEWQGYLWGKPAPIEQLLACLDFNQHPYPPNSAQWRKTKTA